MCIGLIVAVMAAMVVGYCSFQVWQDRGIIFIGLVTCTGVPITNFEEHKIAK